MRVLFVCSGNSEIGINPIVKAQGDSLSDIGIEVDYFMIKGRGLGGYVKNIGTLKRFLKKNDYQLVHAHYGFCGIISHLAKKREKLIVSFMGEDLLASYDFDGNYTLISRLYVKLNTFFAKKYDYVIVKSREMQQVLGNKIKSAVIANGVNTEQFHPMPKDITRKELGIDPTKKFVIFVSNPDRPEKNFKLAKEAFFLLDFENKELKAVFNIPQDQLTLYYNAADALLLTSLHEGSPNVVKEALACNCPVVSSNVGDVNELIQKSKGGLITSFNNIEIAEALKKVLSSGKRTDAREFIVQNFNSKDVARQIIDIYNKILNN